MQESAPAAKIKLPPPPPPESSFGQGLKADPPFSIPNLSPRSGSDPSPSGLGSIPVLPPVQPGQPPKTPFASPAPAPESSLPVAPPAPAPPLPEPLPQKRSIPLTQPRKTATPSALKNELPIAKIIGAGAVIGLLGIAAIYLMTKPDAGTGSGASAPAFPKEGPPSAPESALPALISRGEQPPPENEKTDPPQAPAAPASSASAAAIPEPKPLVAPQLRKTADSSPIFEAAKSSAISSRPSAFFAAPPKPSAAEAIPKAQMEKLVAERLKAQGNDKPSINAPWVFEGKAYDLISLDALGEATLIFSDKAGKELGRTTTNGQGKYKISLEALPEGYRLSVQAQEYSDKYIDEISPPFSELDSSHRKDLAKIAAQNRPWIGGDLKTKRDFVAIPKYIPEN